MTSTEPMTYKPGPGLDRRIAMKLFGFEAHPEYFAVRQPGMKLWREPIDYSTSWVGMKLVVEEMQRRGYWSEIGIGDGATFVKVGLIGSDSVYGRAEADSAPHAVSLACLSALQHVSNTEEDKDA